MRATFDPVGSTATLVIERFRQNGMEPSRPTALMLLGAILSDTIILNSPTTTERDRAMIEYLGRVLAIDAEEFGRDMFEQTTDTADVPATKLVCGDVKDYPVGGGRPCSSPRSRRSATSCSSAATNCWRRMREERERRDAAVYALMVTDILARAPALVAGNTAPLERAFGEQARDGVIDLPGVMSRKKQVAPKVLAVF